MTEANVASAENKQDDIDSKSGSTVTTVLVDLTLVRPNKVAECFDDGKKVDQIVI